MYHPPKSHFLTQDYLNLGKRDADMFAKLLGSLRRQPLLNPRNYKTHDHFIPIIIEELPALKGKRTFLLLLSSSFRA